MILSHKSKWFDHLPILRPSLHYGRGKHFELKIVGALPAGFVAEIHLREEIGSLIFNKPRTGPYRWQVYIWTLRDRPTSRSRSVTWESSSTTQFREGLIGKQNKFFAYVLFVYVYLGFCRKLYTFAILSSLDDKIPKSSTPSQKTQTSWTMEMIIITKWLWWFWF